MRIGDRVRIKLNKEVVPKEYWNCEGIIVAYEREESCYKKTEYWVQIKGLTGVRWFCYDELEKIE